MATDIDSIALDVARRFTEEWDPQRRASLQVAIIQAIRSAHAPPVKLAEQQGGGSLNTSEGGRRYIADFFSLELRRHDFTRYITTTLAADFACALAQHLAATGNQQVGEGQGDAQAQFEAWARPRFRDAEAFERIDGRPGGWEYNGNAVHAAWAAWQAALAARQPGAQLHLPPDGYYKIVCDDAEVPDESFARTGALDAALRRFEQISVRWNAHLFVRFANNTRDCTVPNAAPAQGIDLEQQQDAARWRWVREQNGVTVSVEEADDDGDMAFVSGHTPEELDAAIDSQRDAAPGVDRG